MTDYHPKHQRMEVGDCISTGDGTVKITEIFCDDSGIQTGAVVQYIDGGPAPGNQWASIDLTKLQAEKVTGH